MSEDLSVDLKWRLGQREFAPGEYSGAHEVMFNGALAIICDAAPEFNGNDAHANPEQGLAASLASCHMLTFLALAAKMRWQIKSYSDHAVAHIGKQEDGAQFVNKIELTPTIEFADGFTVEPEQMDEMHMRAHKYCFVANSLSDDVEVVING